MQWLPGEARSDRSDDRSHSQRRDGTLGRCKDFCGAAIDLEQMQVIDGIAHIPIGGVIGKKLSGMEKGSGAVDVNDVAQELIQACADPAVTRILLHIDSPGGMVTGTGFSLHLCVVGRDLWRRRTGHGRSG